MSSASEITERPEVSPPRGWILYDRDCRACSAFARRATPTFARRGFEFAALQEPWVQQQLGLTQEEALREMRVLSRDGGTHGGADAVIFLAHQVWWMAPLPGLAQFSPVRALLHRLYRFVAANRTGTIATGSATRRPTTSSR
ncbi:hypothetical protein BH20VER1_BH20VER1_30940 [soil metagenome]